MLSRLHHAVSGSRSALLVVNEDVTSSSACRRCTASYSFDTLALFIVRDLVAEDCTRVKTIIIIIITAIKMNHLHVIVMLYGPSRTGDRR